MSISANINVSTTYTRSVNIERDSQSDHLDYRYIPTSRALRTLGDIAKNLSDGKRQRAWSLIGPYGSGKSSFALFLTDLLTDPTTAKAKKAQHILLQSDASLQAIFKQETQNNQGYVRVLISGTPERLSIRYLRGLHFAMTNYWGNRKDKKPNIFTQMSECLADNNVTISQLLDITKFCQQTLANIGCPGILIVFDEFGKFLEFESRTMGVSDSFLLQTLAEQSCANHKCKLLLFVLLHQSIEQYANGLGETLKNEWAKIQGRFEEIPFLESTEQTLRVVEKVIEQLPFEDTKVAQKVDNYLQETVKTFATEKILPDNLTEDSAVALFKGLYPLHPLSAMILPNLCQLISQNERTLFSYLASQEQNGFKYMLEQLESIGKFIKPDQIFDYFLSNQSTINGDYLTQRRWAEAISVVDRIHDISQFEISILKTIGVINLLGNRNKIKASKPLLISVFGKATSKAIANLQKKSAIIFRKLNNEYRVWQGSDFDIEAEIKKQLNQTGNFSLAEVITSSQNISSIIARKYSIKNGTLRYCSIIFVDALLYKTIHTQQDLQIFIFLSSGQDDQQIYQQEARDYLSGFGLVGFYDDSEQILKNLVTERIALENIEQTSKQIEDDPVAKKEIITQLSAIRQAETHRISQIIFNPQDSDWTYKQKKITVENRKDFQQQLSEILEKIYNKTPIIHNEIINRDKPSAQGVAARNKLLLAMLQCSNKENLGIEKFPPEKSIYNSVLKAQKIHRIISGKWKICVPESNTALLPVWNYLEQTFFEATQQSISFAKTNLTLLSAPYGVKAGLLPILWLAVYLVHKDELALYEERRYIPGFTPELLERFVKRPDQFSVQYFKIDALKSKFIEQYCKVIFGEDRKIKTVLDIAKPLASFMHNLPEYTRTTKEGISQKAIAFRTAFNLAKSPEYLLYESLPKVLGYTDFNNQARIKNFEFEFKTVLKELNEAHSNLIESMKKELAKMLNLDTEITLVKLKNQSQGKCFGLTRFTIDIKGIQGLLVRINRDEEDPTAWFENILLFLSKKSSKQWMDIDYIETRHKIMQYGPQFRDLQKLAVEEHKYKEDKGSEVYLLKSLKLGRNSIEKVVVIKPSDKKSVEKIQKKLEKVLSECTNDDKLKLMAIAQMADDILDSEKKANNTDTNIKKITIN